MAINDLEKMDNYNPTNYVNREYESFSVNSY